MRPAEGASSDSESEPDHPHDEDEDNILFTTKQPIHGATFRSRILPRHSKGITTAPGQLGAGETETEADEPVSIPRCYNFLIGIDFIISQNTYQQHGLCPFRVR
jgi:hypothetical protein